MAQTVTILASGLKEIAADCRRAKDKEIPKAMRLTNMGIAQEVAAGAKGRIRSQSGALAASVVGRATATSASVRAGGPNAPYAPAIHWGWRKHNITSNPFLTDASRGVEAAVLARYQSAIDTVTEQVSA